MSAPATAVDPARAGAEFLARIPREYARAHVLLSQGRDETGEQLVVAPTTSAAAVWNAAARLGVPVTTTEADPEAIARAIDLCYGTPGRGGTVTTAAASDADPASPASELDALIAAADRDLLRTEGKGQVVKLVDALLFEAVGRGASDVHVQPLAGAVLVRFRLDGALVTVRELPKTLSGPLLGRIKVMGRLDVAERRLPQDGRATVTIGPRAIDLRIGIFPTSYGERAVLRLLDPDQRLTDLPALGMPENLLGPYLDCAGRANGFLLVTGPTGSGKTTTLYATLARLAAPDVNVMTIEDPVEYDLASAGLAVSQAQVQAKKGVTFATGLKHLLRQDPDVILVGEIRDGETARMAIQSSLTGHMVFSTLHTNDAPGAVTRLVDLGVEPFLVSAALSGVLAQRLVRRVHRACAARGCAECSGTGFLGRIGIFEWMPVTESLRSLIARGADPAALRAAATAAGMRTLSEEGARLVAAGETTAVEVSRVVQGDGMTLRFRYRAVATSGTGSGTAAAGGGVTAGELAGDSAREVRARLLQAGLQVLELRPCAPAALPRWLPLQARVAAYLRARRRPQTAELLDGLATLLETGIPLVEALETQLAGESAQQGATRRMLAALRDAVKDGGGLASALAALPAWYDPVEVALVRAGEHGGHLASTLRTLADQHERAGAIGHKLVSALAYPTLVACAGLSVWLFLSTKTLPDLTKILTEAHVEVPALTQRVMATGRLLVDHGILLLSCSAAAVTAGIAGLRALSRRRPAVAARLAALTPVVLRRGALARALRSLAALLEGGVPLVEGLRVVAPTVPLRALRARIEESAAAIERGRRFSETLEDARQFPAELRRLVETGEATGELAALLAKLGQRLERSAQRRVDRLTALLEPAVILTLALLIGLVVMAAILPIVRLREIV